MKSLRIRDAVKVEGVATVSDGHRTYDQREIHIYLDKDELEISLGFAMGSSGGRCAIAEFKTKVDGFNPVEIAEHFKHESWIVHQCLMGHVYWLGKNLNHLRNLLV
jgi:hypothetical protein